MKILKKVSVVKDEIEDVICNVCGEKIQKDDYGNIFDYLSIEKKWGYYSKCDGEKHSFDICENCYHKLAETFKIKINIE